jgi:serine phosphatase RsbU (regulator of sigma subunit)
MFYTDGLFEVADAADRLLGMRGFLSIAQTTWDHDLFAIADHVLRAIHEHQHGPNTDDQTLVVAEFRPSASSQTPC